MNRLLALALALGGVSGVACKAHLHGLEPNTELVTIELTSGLT